MQNVPQSALNRLQSQAVDSHPDADLLTAFAEQSLAGSERDHVMEHLARCGDCREVVALALPASEEAVAVNPGVIHSGWLTWPAFRWSFIAAGILAVASIGVVQFRHSPGTLVATSLKSPEPLTEARSAQPAPVAAPEATAPESRTQNVTQEKKGASARGASSAKTVTTADAVFAQPRPLQRSSPAIVGGAASRVGSGAGMGRGFAAASRPAQNNFSPAPPPANDSVVARAKPASAQAPSMMSSPSLRTDPTLMKSQPRWIISDGGALQRSLDAGKTWQDVTIVAERAESANLVRSAQPAVPASTSTVEVSGAVPLAQTETSSQDSADAAEAKPQESSNGVARMKSALKSASGLVAKPAAEANAGSKDESASNPIFRALSVSSDAAEVWAGASGAMLYHTVDGGNRWVRVIPSDSGMVLTGDILSIQFANTAQVSIRTSTAESWITLDGGRTWHKRP